MQEYIPNHFLVIEYEGLHAGVLFGYVAYCLWCLHKSDIVVLHVSFMGSIYTKLTYGFKTWQFYLPRRIHWLRFYLLLYQLPTHFNCLVVIIVTHFCKKTSIQLFPQSTTYFLPMSNSRNFLVLLCKKSPSPSWPRFLQGLLCAFTYALIVHYYILTFQRNIYI